MCYIALEEVVLSLLLNINVDFLAFSKLNFLEKRLVPHWIFSGVLLLITELLQCGFHNFERPVRVYNKMVIILCKMFIKLC